MKKFKIAEITTVSHLEDIKDNQYHMCLAHLVSGNSLSNLAYTDFYKRMVAEGKFVLMDNGAAENSQLDICDLIDMYEKINPSEIVVPDTLCNCKDTLRKTLSFIHAYGEKLPYRFMAVPQGETIEEWLTCARIMLMEPRINTLGISKFLNIRTKNPMVRYEVLTVLEQMMDALDRQDIEVHLLGCDEGPGIVREIQEQFKFVRGCDSAFAYIGTQAGVPFEPSMERPAGEIDFLNGDKLNGYKNGAEQFEILCGVTDNAVDHSWK